MMAAWLLDTRHHTAKDHNRAANDKDYSFQTRTLARENLFACPGADLLLAVERGSHDNEPGPEPYKCP